MNISGSIEHIKNKANAVFNKSSLFSVRELCELVEAEIPKGLNPEDKFTYIAPDFRMIIKDCLFLANYKNVDADAKKAINMGAKAYLTDHEIAGAPCVVVKDTNEAAYKIAKRLYARYEGTPAVVIAGSVGKTTTKYFLKKVFSEKYKTFCYENNANTIQFLSYLIQSMNKNMEFVVQEVDERRTNNTKNCSKVLSPKVAIITNMAESHIGDLGGQEGVNRSIAGIEEGLNDDGVVIINADNANSLSVDFKHKVIKIAIYYADADAVATNIHETEEGIAFDLTFDGETTAITLPIHGRHNVYNAMMTFVAAKVIGLTSEEILSGISKVENYGYRQNVWTSDKYLIYADCYNSSLTSAKAALECFSEIPAKNNGKKVAVLGDIAELEGFEQETYSQIAKALDNTDIDVLVTYGKDSNMIADYVTKENCKKLHASTSKELDTIIKKLAQDGCTSFLFKASRSMTLEKNMEHCFPDLYKQGMRSEKIRDLKWKIFGTK